MNLELKTCNDCSHFHRYGTEARGCCYALPPTVFQNNNSLRPQVSMKDRQCGLFKDGGATVAVKVNPDTPGLAAKAARAGKRV